MEYENVHISMSCVIAGTWNYIAPSNSISPHCVGVGNVIFKFGFNLLCTWFNPFISNNAEVPIKKQWIDFHIYRLHKSKFCNKCMLLSLYEKSIIIQCNLNLVTILVLAKTVTKSHNVTKWLYVVNWKMVFEK